jgi:branched-subunit amino acid transport protein
MSDWLTVLLAGLGSYGLRMSMIINDRLRLPTRLEASVELVPPAAFSALAASGLATALLPAPTVRVAAPVVVAAVVSAIAAARTGRSYAALFGLPAYWLVAGLLEAGA